LLLSLEPRGLGDRHSREMRVLRSLSPRVGE